MTNARSVSTRREAPSNSGPLPERFGKIGTVIHGDNAAALPLLPDQLFSLIYIDPPFNTGRARSASRTKATRDDQGAHVWYGNQRYRTEQGEEVRFSDSYEDYMAFIEPRLAHAHRLLADDGTLYFHIDYREAHYCKVLLDGIFGRECFLNEIIWAYDYGAKPKNRWPAKHDTILVYVKNPDSYWFDQDAVERIPYMTPGLGGNESRGKMPTDVWWHTIVPTNSKERTGYPTQKPEGVMHRIMSASSRPGDMVLDFFAGSGTTGVMAQKMGRRFVLADSNAAAIHVMRPRIGDFMVNWIDTEGNPLVFPDHCAVDMDTLTFR